MECVCLLKGVKPNWGESKKLLGDGNFLDSLKVYDKDNIDEKILKKLQKYIKMEDFNPEKVGKVSTAAKSLCMWVIAMDTYSGVSKTVEPKKKQLKEAEETLGVVMSELKEKEDSLKAVTDKVAALQAQLKEAQDESERLIAEAALTEARLGRAAILTGALGAEASRWTEEVASIGGEIELLVGDVFLSASCVSYFGAFDSVYRNRITTLWRDGCVERAIPCSAEFSLPKVLGVPVTIRQWNLEGLPSDSLSTENGILVTSAKRWPLMIDPQQQASKWVRNMEQTNGLRLIKLSDGNFLRILEGAIRIGSPVLCEDLGEEVDPALEPVLIKSVVKQGGRNILRLGETDVDYDENFRFYMTSKLPNPHYLPELCIKVTLINFTVTMIGLEDQVMAHAHYVIACTVWLSQCTDTVISAHGSSCSATRWARSAPTSRRPRTSSSSRWPRTRSSCWSLRTALSTSCPPRRATCWTTSH
jgi:dynein heavy chain